MSDEEDGFLSFSAETLAAAAALPQGSSGGSNRYPSKKKPGKGNITPVTPLLKDAPAPWMIWHAHTLSSKLPRTDPHSIPHPSRMALLHNEILALHQFLRPSEQEQKERDALMSTIREHVKSLWPDAQVELFGSSQGEFSWAGGDLDIAILNVSIKPPPPPPSKKKKSSRKRKVARKEVEIGEISDDESSELSDDSDSDDSELESIESDIADSDCVESVPLENEEEQTYMYDETADAILALTAHLKARMNFDYVEPVLKARVPILKARDAKSGIEFDFCLNLASGGASGAYMRQQAMKYPALIPLTLTLKVFFSQRKIADVYSGGLGSYATALLVLSLLQNKRRLEQHRKSVLRDMGKATTTDCTSGNLGALLVEFFHTYGIAFNFNSVGISTANGGRFLNKRLGEVFESGNSDDPSYRPSLLTLENPCEAGHDVGKSTFALPKIRRAMEHGFQMLSYSAALPCACRDGSKSRPEKPFCPAYPCPALVCGEGSMLCNVIRGDDPMLLDRLKKLIPEETL